MWDLTAGKTFNTLTNHKKGIRGLVFHHEEETFASAAADNLKVNFINVIYIYIKYYLLKSRFWIFFF